jgi:predicted ATPase
MLDAQSPPSTSGLSESRSPPRTVLRRGCSRSRAVAGARERGARLFELRAAASLARLLVEAGRRYEGKELLGRIYSWFTEGFEAADLKEARALLSELA